MKTIDFSGQKVTEAKGPQKNVWYQDLVIILFVVMVFYCVIFGEIQIM